MSTKKKTKKLRRPNYVAAGLAGGALEHRGAGETPAASPRPDSRTPAFDYTHVKQDMRRIFLLAGACVTLIVALSFFIR